MPYKDLQKQKQSQHNSYLRNKSKILDNSRMSKKIAKIVISLIKESKPCKDCRQVVSVLYDAI